MINKAFTRRAGLLAAMAILLLSTPAGSAESGVGGYVQRNLVSDGSIPAEHSDANMINPWGMASTPTGMVWIAGNGTSASMVYDGQGIPLHDPPLAVDIPGGSPTGVVSNDGAEFEIAGPGGKSESSIFIFATEAGIISGWSYNLDPANAIAAVDNADKGAVYKGIAIAANGSHRLLYATDFHGAKVDVFDSDFKPLTLPVDAFKDPSLPAGFAPFGIHNINGNLYITYARQDEDKREAVAGPGLGFVNIFDPDGRLIRRLGSKGHLNAPWGMALAPADFGRFGNHLLIANFGDGRINAYNLVTGEFKGELRDSANRPLAIEGLWSIRFGNGVKDQPTNTLFFTAGPDGENGGLFGRIERPGSLLAARSPAIPPQSKPEEQALSRTEIRETTLQKVEANEGGKGEEPLGNENGAALDTQGQGDEDEAAGHAANEMIDGHDSDSLLKKE